MKEKVTRRKKNHIGKRQARDKEDRKWKGIIRDKIKRNNESERNK